jgi:dolichol-phosphate mannosyltransferase
MTELAVVVPCFNERENLVPLITAIDRALSGIDYEIIIVDDDSEDGTAARARELARSNPRVRVIQRIHRRGLSSAVIEGMMATSAPYAAVIDADMQHDEAILPYMLHVLKAQRLDIVIGTRNAEGGSMGGFSAERVRLSNAGKRISRAVCRVDISDPMSGFFLLDRRFLDEVVRELSQTGFKILVDILASAKRPVRFAEAPYSFRLRQRGESKLDIVVGLEFGQLIVHKWIGGFVPLTYVIFGMVGALGVLLNMALLYILEVLGLKFSSAFILSATLVIAINFVLNNLLTFRSRRLRGISFALGLLIFYAGCGIGLAANLEIAKALKAGGIPELLAGLIGVTLGSVWNYAISSVFVWQVKRHFSSAQQTARTLVNT